MSEPNLNPDPRAMAPRKRVVAREVTEVELANRNAAALAHDAVVAPHPADHHLPLEPVVVVDPTTLGRRHRRSSHERIYRWTQACTLLAFLAGIVAVFCTIGDDIAAARVVAGSGLALGLIATVISGRTSLSARWRGWAIAAVVFAVAVLLLTWIQPAITAEEHDDPHTRLPGRSSNGPPEPRPP